MTHAKTADKKDDRCVIARPDPKSFLSRVFIVNRGHHDYTKAQRYGEIAYLTQGRISIRQVDNMVASIEKGLAEATPDDYLLLSGHIIPNGIALASLIRKFGTAKCLVFIGEKDDYEVLHIRGGGR